MMWALVALAGILWLAYTASLDHDRKMARAGGASPEALRALADRLGAVEADRERLRARVEVLEAIVTDEGFDLAREARRAGLAPRVDASVLDAAVVADSLSDPSPPSVSDVADAARRARTT